MKPVTREILNLAKHLFILGGLIAFLVFEIQTIAEMIGGGAI